MPDSLHLTNTMSRKKEPFISRRKGLAKIFTCGPSVYRRAHVGNYRTFLYEDVLHRYLEYLGYRVERLMNFTDVEDKAIDEAKTQGVGVQEVTGKVEEGFFKEIRLLRIKNPNIGRASTSVDQAVKLIGELLERGYAYRHNGDIFYDPLKFKGFGKLFGLDMSRWPKKKRRFRKDTYPGRRWNLGDFILWHGDRGDGSPSWDTPLGKGRPSWNIQDPAMITAHLGYLIDIACGGVDNLYRHHDYTIAVVEALSGESLAPYWLHGEHVLLSGKKMSKSKGNILYLDNLIQRGVSPEDIRFSLIYTHYRKKLNLTDAYLEKTRRKLAAFRDSAENLAGFETEVSSGSSAEKLASGIEHAFREKMNDDLDVQGAFESVYGILQTLLSLKTRGEFGFKTSALVKEQLKRIDDVLQIFPPRHQNPRGGA